ncbi:MAG: hypothetical protein OEX12_07040 [Gammaproteobacteria bacterium]|nr:hypothetical protein [Gammaproteobacteria bacterium]
MIKSRKEPTTKEYLFNYFVQEHGVTLLESQLEDVINIIETSIEAKYAGVVEALREIMRLRKSSPVDPNDWIDTDYKAKKALKELD